MPKARILVVEDEGIVAKDIQHKLEGLGYLVTALAFTGTEALRLLTETPPDLVLMDIKLPGKMDGIAVANEIRTKADIPVVYLTAFADQDTLQRAKLSEPYGYITKPFSPIELNSTIEVALYKHQMEKKLRASEVRLRNVVTSNLDGMVVIGQDNKVLFANPAAGQLLGFDHEKLVGGPFGLPLNIGEINIPCQEGGMCVAEMRLVTIEWEGKQALLASLRDITERKLAENALRESERRLELQLKRLSALRTIDTAISSSFDLRMTLTIFIDQVINQLGVDAADILLLTPGINTLEYATGRGFHFGHHRNISLRIGDGYAGQAVLERRIITILTPTEDTLSFLQSSQLIGESFQCYFAAPLIAKGQVRGVMELFHRSSFTPDQEWLDFLETLTVQAAIAIDNMSLFENLQQSNTELVMAYDTTLEGWSHTLELRDAETEGHTQRVAEVSVRLGRALGLSEIEIVHLRRGALLHDIGKLGVPDSVLFKPGPLTAAEWEMMHKHPEYAYHALAPIAFLRQALDVPYCHHEKWDGSGYPRGLKGEEIPLAARIFAVIDVWDAMRSARPYRPPLPDSEVHEYLTQQKGKHFDPQVVDAFLRLLAEEKN